MIFGTTLSIKYCNALDLDWEETYLKVFEDLNFQEVRLCAHWDLIESTQGQFNFTDLDKQIDFAEKFGKRVLLAIGRKTPRWPEYHEPAWAKELSNETRLLKTSNYIKEVVERYKSRDAIFAFQVENEPFWSFGNTDLPIDESQLVNEVELVRSLTTKDIVITDTAEWSDLKKANKHGDQVGINIYPIVYNGKEKEYQYNDFNAKYYKKKIKRIKSKVYVSELQCEPWGPGWVGDLSKEEYQKSINTDLIEKNIQLVDDIGIERAHLWGTEWWYFLEKKGESEILEFMKKLIN